MSHQVEQNIRETLDQHVKTMHRLLRQLDPQLRVEYIKEMLPVLLTYSPGTQSAPTRIKEKMQSPLQSLSQKELDLINELGKKTESLYHAMNNGSHNYFG